MTKRSSDPHARNVGGIDESDGKRSFAPAGKTYKYDSGANTHNVRQGAPRNPPESPGGRSDGPFKRGSGRETR